MLILRDQSTETEIVPFAKCPSCRQLIKLEVVRNIVVTDARICRFCQASISADEINSSFDNYVQLTRALQSAGHLGSSRLTLLICFGILIFEMSIIYWIDDAPIFFIQSVFAVTVFIIVGVFSSCQKWLNDYGFFRAEDEEFLAAKKNIERTRLIGSVAFFLNLVLWLLFMKSL